MVKTQPRIFVSYARSDGEAIARKLRCRLIEEHGLSLWQDRTDMEGGKDWWQQIVEAIKYVEYLILVMTPAALQSDTVRKEWRMARQEGVCVIPVLGQSDLNIATLPRWMRQRHFVDPNIPENWIRFIRTLENPYLPQRVPFMVEDLPHSFIPREVEFQKLYSLLIDKDREEPVAITAALRGAGGFGKTMLAKALCHDERIQEAFKDGILWATLGQNPNVLNSLTMLYAALTGQRPVFVDVEDAAVALAETWGEKDCLLVLDDVWNQTHVIPFLRGGKRCARLITTRDSSALPLKTSHVNLDEMQEAEAIALLQSDLPFGEREQLKKLANRLGYWPVLLSLVNGVLVERIRELKQPLSDAIRDVNNSLDDEGLTAFDVGDELDRNKAVAKTLSLSFERLSPDQRTRYEELAIFPEDAEIPLDTLCRLWNATGGLKERAVVGLCTRFFRLSMLVRFDLATRQLKLHDVMRAYLLKHNEHQMEQLHGKFLDAFKISKWENLSEEEKYLWRNIGYHFIGARRSLQLQQLLLDFNWLQTKLNITDVNSLLGDFDFIMGEKDLSHLEGIRIVMEAIRLSSHVLVEDKIQLAGQLLGRLSIHPTSPLNELRKKVIRWKGATWLRPLVPVLIPPGGPLLRTLSGHLGVVRSVTLSSEGSYVVSASDDQTIKIWDFDTGKEIRTLTGHTDWVRAVAVSPDGRQIVSASDDQTLRLWEMETGRTQKVLPARSDWIKSLVMANNGKYVISCAQNLKMWDLQEGKEVRTLRGHRAKVNGVALTYDGKLAISGSDDGTLKVWECESGKEVRTIRGHCHKVNAVLVRQDGHFGFSASSDGTVRMWDLRNGALSRIISDQTFGIRAMAITMDGSRLVYGSDDGSIAIQSLSQSNGQTRLVGHADGVTGLALTKNGRFLVSASEDHTLKIWDLQRCREQLITRECLQSVRAVKFTSDGKFVVSTSDDHILRVWNPKTGKLVKEFQGYTNWAIAVYPHGHRVLCSFGDATMTVLDLDSGKEKLKLVGHTDRIAGMVVAQDGKHAVSASDDRTIKLWNLESASVEREIQLQRGTWVRGIALSTDGRYVATASESRSLKVWDIDKQTECLTLRKHTARINGLAFFSQDRNIISASEDHTLKIWDRVKGKEIGTLKGHGARVNNVAVTPNASHAVSVGHDYSVRVWNLENRSIVAAFRTESPVWCCAIAPNGKTIVAGDASGRVHFFSFENQQKP